MAKFDELRKKYNKMFEEEAKKHGVTPYKPTSGENNSSRFGNIRQQLNQQMIAEMNKPKEVSTPEMGAPSVSPKSSGGFLSSISKIPSHVGDVFEDIGNIGKNAWGALNPFDDIGFKEGIENIVNDDRSKTTQEMNRSVSRTANKMTLDSLDSLHRAVNGSSPEHFNSRKFGDGGGVDLLSDMVGYLAPYSMGYNALKGTSLAANYGKNAALGTKMAQRAKEGAAAGGLVAGAQTGAQELGDLFSGENRYGLKDHLTRTGIEVAAGGALDSLMPLGRLGLDKLRGNKAAAPRSTSTTSKPQGPYPSGAPQGPNQIPQLPPGQFLLNPGKVKSDFSPPKSHTDEVLALNPGLDDINRQIDALEYAGRGNDIPALPEGQRALNPGINQRRLKHQSPVPQQTDEILELPEALSQNVIKARKLNNYYADRLNELMELARGRDTPVGLEREVLEDLWSSIARAEDPNLDELIELGTPSLNRLNLEDVSPIELIKQARKNQQKTVYGIDSLLNRLKTEKQYVPFKNEGEPLQFKRQLKTEYVEEPMPSFTAKSDPMNGTRVEYQKPRIDEEYLNSLKFGDDITIRKDRAEADVQFVTRNGNSVVVRTNRGREVTVPAELVVSKPVPSSGPSLNRTLEMLKNQRNSMQNPSAEGNPLPFKREVFKGTIETTPTERGVNVTAKGDPANYESFVGRIDPMNATRAEYNAPRVDDNLLNSLKFGDKVEVRQGRGGVEVEFVKREGNNVIVRRKGGREVVVPAEMILPKRQQSGVEQLINNLKRENTSAESAAETSDIPKMNLKFFSEKEIESLLKSIETENLKDISGFKGATSDVYRIFRDVFGKDFGKIKGRILNPLDKAKADYVDMQEKWLNELNEKIVKGFGIKKGSKSSALIQKYGEKQITLDELKQQAPEKWQDIVEADKWFRKAYDELIDAVNETRKKIYPTNPDKLIPKRKDYYRHFNEFTGLTGLKNMFDSPSAIDPHLQGTSQYTTPRTKFQGFMQKRGLGPFKNDAVGGFLDYIPAASYATKIDPMIPKFRQLKKELADRIVDSKELGNEHLENFLEFVENYANDLAGKTNPFFDRNIQTLIPGGRKTMKILNWLNRRVKANVILGNISSLLAQSANIPTGIAFAKHHSAEGIQRTFSALFDKSAPIHNSAFLKERFSDGMYRRFDHRWFEQPQKAAAWAIETADRIGASFIWNSSYAKGVAEGVENPARYADEHTRRLIAGRGVGEVPLVQKAKVTQIVAPFTLEVGNLWRVMGDMTKTKDIGGLALLFLGSFVLNRAMEETRGFKVMFDPIDAIYDAVTEEDASLAERVGRVGGEVLSNMSLGQHLANVYPERGIEALNLPTRAELFGDRNPQRFGSGLLMNPLAKGSLTDAASKVILPFGGNQIKKTTQGILAMDNEGVYDGDKLKYPVNDLNVIDRLQALLFGPSALDDSQSYYEDERRPLSERQTQIYEKKKEAGEGDKYYDALMFRRHRDTIKQKVNEIKKDPNLDIEEKKTRIKALIAELQAYKQTN